MLFLALKGEDSVKDALTRFIVERTNPMRLREVGVKVFGEHALKTEDERAAEVLYQIIRDNFQFQRKRVKPAGGDAREMVALFPTRRATVKAIKRMDDALVPLLPRYIRAAEKVPYEVPLPKPAGRPCRRRYEGRSARGLGVGQTLGLG